jgi:hypothetical protein
MFTNTQSGSSALLLSALLAGSLLFSACSPAGSTTTLPHPTAISASTATLQPTATVAPAATVVPTSDRSLQPSLDIGSLATGFQTEVVPAVPAGEDAPFWEVLPEYTQVTLQGYPVSNHRMKPQIFIYPATDLGKVNEGAAKIVASLQTLLQSPQEIPTMPFLPLFNAAQMMHARVHYLDFKSGQGLRYLTQFAQGLMPINNYEIIYTYQGLTSDRKHYVAAVLPVTHPSLPADGRVTGSEPPEFTSDFPAYLANVVKTLTPQAASTFTPDLT